MSDGEKLHDVAARFKHSAAQQDFDKEIGPVSADVVTVGNTDWNRSADHDDGVSQPATRRFVGCIFAAECD